MSKHYVKTSLRKHVTGHQNDKGIASLHPIQSSLFQPSLCLRNLFLRLENFSTLFMPLTIFLFLSFIISFPLQTEAFPTSENSAKPEALCSHLAPVTNECVEAGLQQRRKTLRERPEYQIGDPETHLKLAKLLMQQGDPTGAIEEYQAAIRLNPLMAEAFREMGAVYLDTHNWKSAEKALKRSIQLEESDAQAQFWLGRALLPSIFPGNPIGYADRRSFFRPRPGLHGTRRSQKSGKSSPSGY